MKEGSTGTSSYIPQPDLQPECSHQGHIMAMLLRSHGDYLLVGDLIRSISLLQYKSAESTLEEVATDFNANMMRAIEVMDGQEDHFIGCDDFGNMFVAKHQPNAATEEEQSKLSIQGEFHMGDYVNTLRRGSLIVQPIDNNIDAPTQLTASSLLSGNTSLDIFDPNYRNVTGYPNDHNSVIFATISGVIGSILGLSEASYYFFAAVQTALRKSLRIIEGFSHEDWRSFQNESRSSPQKNVIDGDLVELLLDLSKEELIEVTKDVNEELSKLIQSGANNSSSSAAGSSANSSESASALISSLVTSKVQFTAEEIIRRVEDIARLH